MRSLSIKIGLGCVGLLVSMALSACPDASPSEFTYRVVAEFPHDRGAFTQGLEIVDGVMFEGTGINGQSTLRRVDRTTGEVLQTIALDAKYFGEGITVFGDRIFQLTWRNETCFVHDRVDFTLEQTFTYPTEGWGLTHDGERLIMSDGTSNLYFRDPGTFEEIGHVQVIDGIVPVTHLNELEFIDGEVYANVWLTDDIVRIDPETGAVTGRIHLDGLLRPEDPNGAEDVLNGIAYDNDTDKLYVTGKRWPKLYEIELVPVAGK